MQTVLIVEDEEMIRDAIASYLEKQGYRVLAVETGQDALEQFRQEEMRFVILDLMLPDMDGEDICRAIRENSNVPILMLTAKTQEEDILHGLEIGADDYMKKPFSLKELYARMKVILRRTEEKELQKTERYAWNDEDLILDFDLRKIWKKKESIQLTPIEWKILSALVHHPNKIYTRDELIQVSFPEDFDGYDRVIDTHIKNLRKKLEDQPKNPVYVKTVHGVGYKFGGEES